MRRLILAVCMLLLGSCNNHRKPVNEQFDIHYIDMNIKGNLRDVYCYRNFIIGRLFDETFFVLDSAYNHMQHIEAKLNNFSSRLSDIAFYDHDMLLFLKNHKVVVFDTGFNQRTEIEAGLNSLTPDLFFYTHDSLFVFGSRGPYAVYGNYRVQSLDTGYFFNRLKAFFKRQVYSDSDYNVYACELGEWGGNVFFQNKRSGKTYSLPTYFGEIVRYKNAYHLIHNFQFWTRYLEIKDPAKLYLAAPDTGRIFCCNCDPGYYEYYYKMNDSEKRQWEKQRGVTAYFETNQVQTLKTFALNDKLYSLCIVDSFFVILQHTDSVKGILAIPKMDKRIVDYSSVRSANDKNKIVIGLNGTSWQANGATGSEKEIDELGIIVIRGNRIDICESYSEKPWNRKAVP